MIYFIYGLESKEFKYAELIKKIKEENNGIDEFVYDAKLKEESNFMERINFNSIFSGKELIVLKRSELTKDIETIIEHLINLNLDSKYVVFDYLVTDMKKKSKFFDLLTSLDKDNRIKLEIVNEKENNRIEYIMENLNIKEREALKLIELIGNNPFKIKNEIEKIKLYLGDEKYSETKAREIISINKDYLIYECVEKIISGQYKEMINYLEKTKEYMSFLYMFYSEMEIFFKLHVLEKEGIHLSDNYNKFKNEYENVKNVFKINKRVPHPYSIFLKNKNAKKISFNKVNKLLLKIWETENNIKRGKIPQEIGIEELILTYSL